MPTFFQQVVAFGKLVSSGASEAFIEDLDFAVQRINFQANDQDRHVYQSYRALHPFMMFGGFSAVSSTALLYTKILSRRPEWPLGLHFKFCLMLGATYMLAHHYISPPLEIRHLLTTPNSSYTKVCYAVLETRPDRDLWVTAFGLPDQPQVESNRRYFAVPNFQHSGHAAVIVANPNIKQAPSVQYSTSIDPLIPVDGIELDEAALFEDIKATNLKYHAAKLDSALQTNSGQYDAYAAGLLKSRSIASFCSLHDIPMPSYYDEFKMFGGDTKVLERPVDFLHMYNEDDKKVRGHLPLAFQSPMDIIAVNKSRKLMQEQVNEQAKVFFQEQEDLQKGKAIGTPQQQEQQV